MALELEEVDSFLNEFTQFTDSQRNGVKQLFLKLQNVSELTIDFNSLDNCLDSIHPTEFYTKDQYLLFISKYFTTKGIFLNLHELQVHNLTATIASHHDIVITDCIEQLPHNLTTLDITGCALSNDMQENLQLWSLTEIRTLKLDSTKLTNLPPSIGRLRKLENVSLSHNQLTTLPLTLEFCQNLQSLNISHNKFKAVPAVVLNLKNLKSLRRLSNPLLHRWDGMETFPHIRETKTPKQNTDIVETLQSLSARTVMTFHIDYWSKEYLPSLQCKLLDTYGSKYYYCYNCHTATGNNNGRRIEVVLLIFGDVRDVPFNIYSCESCSDIIREKLIVKQERLQKWIEEDHAKRMKEAMKEAGIPSTNTTTATTATNNNKHCIVM